MEKIVEYFDGGMAELKFVRDIFTGTKENYERIKFKDCEDIVMNSRIDELDNVLRVLQTRIDKLEWRRRKYANERSQSRG